MAQKQDGSDTTNTPAGLARLAAELAIEKKGEDVVVLDLRRFSIGCDFFVIITATSVPHVRAVAEWIEEEMTRRRDVRPWHREGFTQGRWILLDYVDWVVHVFLTEARQYYLLERLWGDAPREDVSDPQAEEGSDESGS